MIPSKTTNHRSLRGYGVWGVLALLLWSGAVPLKHGALLQAGEALDDWKAAKQQFLLGIKTKDADAVLDALESFRVFDSEEVAELLVRHGLSHQDMEVYRESELLLRSLNNKDAQKVVARVAHKDKSRFLRADCVRILAHYRTEETFAQLKELLEDKEWLVRSESIRAISTIREKRVVPVLIARMHKEEGRILDDLRDALQDLTKQSFRADAKEWQSWWDAFGKTLELPPEDATGPSTVRKKLGTAVKEGLYGNVVSQRVAFLIDVSGSMTAGTDMAGTRHEIATKELVRVLENQVGPDSEFNVIAFSDEVHPFGPKLQKGKGAKVKKGIRFVKSLKAGGETNAYGALEKAFQDTKVDTIYVLSDGSPTVGEETIPALILRQVQEWNRYRGVKVHCIGFFPGEARHQDKAEARTFLIDLADQNRGRYVEID